MKNSYSRGKTDVAEKNSLGAETTYFPFKLQVKRDSAYSCARKLLAQYLFLTCSTENTDLISKYRQIAPVGHPPEGASRCHFFSVLIFLHMIINKNQHSLKPPESHATFLGANLTLFFIL